MIHVLARWLVELTGMPALALAQGRRARRAVRHDDHQGRARRAASRSVILVRVRARRQPGDRSLLGYRVEPIAARADGTVDVAEVRKRLSGEVAAIMLTNPNTCGLFERDIAAIAEAVHAAGAFLYADGANFNAIMGKVRPGDLGVDAMHLNLHKTFSTPHGGGGAGAPARWRSRPRSRPSCRCRISSPRAAGWLRRAYRRGSRGAQSRSAGCAPSTARWACSCAPLAMLSHGADGLRQAAEDAVLNANYVRASLADLMSLPYGNHACMHEVLFDDAWLDGTGIATLDIAKAMIDEGFHPMTVYFPLVVHGAMLIEPTDRKARPRWICSSRRCATWRWPRSVATRRALPARRAMRRAGASTRRGRRATRCCGGCREAIANRNGRRGTLFAIRYSLFAIRYSPTIVRSVGMSSSTRRSRDAPARGSARASSPVISRSAMAPTAKPVTSGFFTGARSQAASMPSTAPFNDVAPITWKHTIAFTLGAAARAMMTSPMAAKAPGLVPPDVGEIRGRNAGIAQQIDQRHAEPGAAGEQRHAAVELDQGEPPVRGARLERRDARSLEARRAIAPILMTKAGIVVEHGLDVERDDLTLRGDADRVDLDQLGVLGEEQAVQLGGEACQRTDAAAAPRHRAGTA